MDGSGHWLTPYGSCTTDSDRECAYDREYDVGCLDKGPDEANVKGWTVFDMKRDWNVVFPTEAP